MNTTLLIQKASTRYHRVGVRGLLRDLWVRCKIGMARSEFDRQYGTDTDGHMQLWRYSIPFASAVYGTPYLSCSEERITQALQSIPRSCTFVDLGCGKGRTLLVAARLGFKEVYGVEFVRELALIAQENIRVTHTHAQAYYGDATQYRLPSGPLCVYLYNPFGPEVMRYVVAQVASRRDETWIVYVNSQVADPANLALWDAFLRRVEEREGCILWHRVGKEKPS